MRSMSPAASRLQRESRTPRKSRPSSEQCRMKMVELPDERGHFGQYGGVFVAETLVHALDELRRAYERCRKDPEFIAEFQHELKHYVRRPTPVYPPRRLSGPLGGAPRHIKRAGL